MIISNLKQIQNAAEKMILPAYEIGKSQLINLVQGLHDHGLLHKIILVAPPETLRDLPVKPPFAICDKTESAAEVIRAIELLTADNHLVVNSIMAVDEEMQYQLSAQIARHFKLPFFEDKTCRTASVKYLSKRMFQDYQVPTGPFELISNITSDTIIKIGFPNVLKPLSGTQSQFVFPNYTMKELLNHFSILSKAAKNMGPDPRFSSKSSADERDAVPLDPKNQFLLEAYIPGDELSCDFMIQDDRLDIVRIVRKIPSKLFGMFRGYALLSEQDVHKMGIDMTYLNDICRRIATGFSIHRGICMVDFKINDQGLFVLESSIRPGLSAFNHLMYVKCGYTSPLLLSLLNMGAQIDLQFPQTNGLVVFLFAPRPGFLTEMDFSELYRRKDEFKLIATHRFSENACLVNDSDVDHTDLIQGYVLIDQPPSELDSELGERISACVKYKWSDSDVPS